MSIKPEQERKWVVSDLALAADWEFFKEDDGSLLIPEEFGYLLAYIGQRDDWATHPLFEGHTLECYLLAVFRAIYHTPVWIVPLVLEEFRSQRRTHKPAPSFVQSLCGAAVEMQRDWKNIGFAHTYRPVEPNLTKRRRSANTPPCHRHKRRVIIDDDEDC